MSKKILVIDDEQDVLKAVEFRLKKEGYDVFSAADGKQGFDMLKAISPNLVLLDLRLPEVDGYELCKAMNADDALKNIPLILFTASDPAHIKDNFGELGADDYIIKPFEYSELSTKIKNHILKNG
ncbi:MAG: hypothetical protein COV72_07370 [Candidatus Omnitrophica bacterium CG11_big_fil_rev_8_21_14_0_20_42_13]|uniref:Response regulatory domain-containing protein n=1 Tax=Candidatus Ghiorseimicrobium undicola TaxID=1974746 RepID=A0A2H0LW24_9BACT|nr:MAG: hypothetical protein COV72_07370 [Candidatus Omnitrophica bacterium CG11_big_fil_rev_8_21_14_0_20_42_13]